MENPYTEVILHAKDPESLLRYVCCGSTVQILYADHLPCRMVTNFFSIKIIRSMALYIANIRLEGGPVLYVLDSSMKNTHVDKVLL